MPAPTLLLPVLCPLPPSHYHPISTPPGLSLSLFSFIKLISYIPEVLFLGLSPFTTLPKISSQSKYLSSFSLAFHIQIALKTFQIDPANVP